MTGYTSTYASTYPAGAGGSNVSWDANGGGITGTAGSTTYSWPHTTAANAVAIAGVAVDANPDSMTLTCKLDGVLMTARKVIHCNSKTAGYLAVFTATGVGSGAHTLLATASAAPLHLSGGSLSFTGASGLFNIWPASPASGNGYGYSTTPSAATGSATTSGGMVVAFCASGSGGITAGAGATSRWMDNYAGVSDQAAGNCGAETAPSTGSVMTMTFTCVSDWWAEILVEVLPA